MRATMRHIEGLLDPDLFLHVHRSAIVNLKMVDKVSVGDNGRRLLRLETNEEIRMVDMRVDPPPVASGRMGNSLERRAGKPHERLDYPDAAGLHPAIDPAPESGPVISRSVGACVTVKAG